MQNQFTNLGLLAFCGFHSFVLRILLEISWNGSWENRENTCDGPTGPFGEQGHLPPEQVALCVWPIFSSARHARPKSFASEIGQKCLFGIFFDKDAENRAKEILNLRHHDRSCSSNREFLISFLKVLSFDHTLGQRHKAQKFAKNLGSWDFGHTSIFLFIFDHFEHSHERSTPHHSKVIKIKCEGSRHAVHIKG